jgi:hypothetical protein
MQFPRTLLEFQAQFPDEDHCWAYLRRARWPQGFLCPHCGSQGSHFIASRRLEQCRCCRYQSSVTAGTVYHGTPPAASILASEVSTRPGQVHRAIWSVYETGASSSSRPSGHGGGAGAVRTLGPHGGHLSALH